MRVERAAAVAVVLSAASALDNGVGLTPAMGFSSWNAVCANVTSAYMRNITRFLIDSGLAAKGFRHVNVDEGWLQGRYPNGTIYEDLTKFPEGMKAFGEWVHAQTIPETGQGMLYGLYTSRGTVQCSESNYQAPGSHGFEALDTAWMASYEGAQADYLKVDSCGATQNHSEAFAEYALFRDALNATGRRVHFSLCGWYPWYAPVGYSLGNQWRIAGDGDSWHALTNCFNTAAGLRQYAGPGGFNDPDLLVGPNSHGPHPTGTCDGTFITDLQARTQFSLWSVIAAPLIISNDLLEASDYYIETLSNTEVIAVDQDPSGMPGARLIGGDLTYPCAPANNSLPPGAAYSVQALPCNASDPLQQWQALPGGQIALVGQTASNGAALVLDVYDCATADQSPVVIYAQDPPGQGTCLGKNQQWVTGRDANGAMTLTNGNARQSCLDVYDFSGPSVDIWGCNNGPNQAWAWSGTQLVSQQSTFTPPLCLAAVPPSPPDPLTCTNVWGRPLHDGTAAFVFVNNGPNNVTVTCNAACFAGANITAPAANGQLVIRDLWAHATVATLTGGPAAWSYSAVVPAEGGSVTFTATPQ